MWIFRIKKLFGVGIGHKHCRAFQIKRIGNIVQAGYMSRGRLGHHH
jgi:hypothetical protein